MNIVNLQRDSGIPKYKQIVLSLEEAIAKGDLKKGDKLPSLNAIKNTFSLSRDTVLVAFNELKNRGIIHSVVGKGYYVSTENVATAQKILLLFDELNAFKEDLYNSFLEHLPESIQVEIFFHHFNRKVFERIINESIGNYTSYVIMPANFENVEGAIDGLPKDKVYLLDQTHSTLKEYAAIYQDFEKDMYKGLFTALHTIRKYSKLLLVFSEDNQPKGFITGFQKFCEKYNFSCEVINSLKDRNFEKGELYIVLNDKNLIRAIKKTREQHLVIAQDIGLISYNDTLLKEVVADGITTISTDFKLMGKTLAGMILENKQEHIANPSKLIYRKSI